MAGPHGGGHNGPTEILIDPESPHSMMGEPHMVGSETGGADLRSAGHLDRSELVVRPARPYGDEEAEMGRSWARQALRTRGFVAPIVPVVGYSAPLAFTYSQSVSVSGASTSGLGGMGLAVLGGLMLHALRKQDGPAVQADVAHRLDF